MNRLHLIFLAVLSGILLSLPWLETLPGWILFVAFVPLLIAEDHIFQNKKRVESFTFFGYAFLSFLVWNALTCWWIMHAAFFGMVLIVSLNAMMMGTIWWLFHSMKRNFSAALGNFSLVIFWLAFEYLHHNWDMEWPWLSLGNGFANQVEMIQWYEFTGVPGGSLWVLIANLLLFQTIKYSTAYRLKKYSYLALSVLIIVIPAVISNYQYKHYQEKGDSFEVVILQPNIDPYTEKFTDNLKEQQLLDLLNLADSLVTDSTDYVIGPETALHPLWEGEDLVDDPQVKAFLLRASTYANLNFLLGATTKKIFQPSETLSATARKDPEKDYYYDIYNSALLINKEDEVQVYHKSILVSGVEKMPFSKYLSFVEKYIVDLGGTTGSLGKQAGPTNFIGTSGLNTAPVICFESVFGEYVSRSVRKGAKLIFIITNDGWWKNTTGYRQHLFFARLRAIETRRSIARSANTGISAFIDQKGDLLQVTKWNEKTAIKGKLTANKEITFYVRYGDFIGRGSMFAGVLLLLYFVVQMIIKDKKNPH
jgi:apolipoprotein N-acyltransferase